MWDCWIRVFIYLKWANVAIFPWRDCVFLLNYIWRRLWLGRIKKSPWCSVIKWQGLITLLNCNTCRGNRYFCPSLRQPCCVYKLINKYRFWKNMEGYYLNEQWFLDPSIRVLIGNGMMLRWVRGPRPFRIRVKYKKVWSPQLTYVIIKGIDIRHYKGKSLFFNLNYHNCLILVFEQWN